MLLIIAALFATASVLVAEDHLVRETGPLSPEEELRSLTVPEGFDIQIFASEPMINKPINLAVDERGRVWVSSTVEYPYAAAKDRWADAEGSRVSGSRDAIKILEDTDGDGCADKVTDFADGLNIPTGVLPWHRPEHKDGCIAWSIPNIWYFADTTGDGKCDHREVLFGPLGYEKDTHGMCSSFRLGSDGWVYATHGFNNTSHLNAKDGSELDMHSGNVFRFRPDGSRVEIWSRGQVNPFGLCFDRRGNLYSADCHSSPVYQLIRGAVYPSFGKPHDGLGFGPVMIEHTHGSTGIAGIVYMDNGLWGGDWNDHLLIGNPVTSRVNHDRIEYTGTTPHAVEQPDFVTSRDPWFRPVDLALGKDGALFIADFYNRIIGHYEVPLDHPGRDRERGRIWRVVKRGETNASVPVAAADSPEPLVGLKDTSPWVRRAAAASLQEKPFIAGIEALRQALVETPADDTHLRHTLRLALKECLSLPGAFESTGKEAEASLASIALAVKSAAAASYLLSCGELDPALLPEGFAGLRRRHIARFGDETTVGELIKRERERFEPGAPTASLGILLEIAEGLEEKSGVVREPALIAAASELVTVLLDQRTGKTQDVWTTRPHPESPASAPSWAIQRRKTSDGREIELISSLVPGEKGAEQRRGVLESRSFALPGTFTFLLCGHRGKPGSEPHEKNYARLVEVENGKELAKAYPPRSDVATPVQWALPDYAGREVRLEIVDGDGGGAYAWLAVGEVKGVSLPTDGFGAAGAETTLLQQVARLLMTSAPVDLRDRLRPFLPPPPPAPPRAISPEEQLRLAAMISKRISSFDAKLVDLQKGETLFSTHCRVCHQVGGQGGLIGPQLTGIGVRGLERIAEDVLDPNRNVDAHFRLTVLTLKDGTTAGGFIGSESGEVIQLIDASGQARRFLLSEVVSREVSAMTLMPAVFGDLLSEADFRDLAGWLLKQR